MTWEKYLNLMFWLNGLTALLCCAFGFWTEEVRFFGYAWLAGCGCFVSWCLEKMWCDGD